MILAVTVAVAWLVVAPLLAVLIGKGIRLADDRRPRPESDEDWLADQPAEILAPAEVDRRLERFEEWA